ncbi:MAG: ABC transporter substrate-binding protein [Betaproteobacteria bacterium]
MFRRGGARFTISRLFPCPVRNLGPACLAASQRASILRNTQSPFLHRPTRRRLLITGTIWPLLACVGAAHAQSKAPGGKPVRVGMLSAGRVSGPQIYPKLFVETLRELGWVEGRNVVYDRVFAEGDFSRLPALAADLVARKPDLVYANNNPTALAAHGKTRTIPIVFSSALDPIGAGLVQGLARPGGNATGVANIGPELAAKRMQVLRDVFPTIQRVGVLITSTGRSPQGTSDRGLKAVEETVGATVKVIPAKANTAAELDAAFSLLAENRVEAVLLTQTALFMTERKRVLELTTKHRLPVMGYRTAFADDGALMSYSEVLEEQVRRAAHIADKILRGAKPADIPVEQPTKFELIINLKTARALGIAIPERLLLQADRVIE